MVYIRPTELIDIFTLGNQAVERLKQSALSLGK